MDSISVIVPIYNVENYFPTCIESIINQTYRELEIILVDDGSTDRSGLICDDYAKEDERIYVIHQKNGGLSNARNRGLAEVSGEYICFVDADDYIAPNMIQVMYDRMINDDSDLVLCDFCYVDIQGEKIISNDNESPIIDELLDYNEAIRKLGHDKKWYFSVAWNKLYRRFLFDDIRFPEGKFHEDEYVAHHILFECKKVSYVCEKLYYYVQRQDSLTKTESVEQKMDGAVAMLDRAVFVLDHHYDFLLPVCLNDLLNIVYECCAHKDYPRYKDILRSFQKKCGIICWRVVKSKMSFKEKFRFVVFCINHRLLYFIHDKRKLV